MTTTATDYPSNVVHRVNTAMYPGSLLAPFGKPVRLDAPAVPLALMFRTIDGQIGLASYYGSAGWSVWLHHPTQWGDEVQIPGRA